MTEKQRRKRIKRDLKGNLKSTAEKLGISVSTVTRVLDYQIVNSEYLDAIELQRDIIINQKTLN